LGTDLLEESADSEVHSAIRKPVAVSVRQINA
jgi:hypothetical protein